MHPRRTHVIARNYLDEKLWNIPEHLRGHAVNTFAELRLLLPATPLFYTPHRVDPNQNDHFPFITFAQRLKIDFHGLLNVAYFCADDRRIHFDEPRRFTEHDGFRLMRSYQCAQCFSTLGRAVYVEGR